MDFVLLLMLLHGLLLPYGLLLDNGMSAAAGIDLVEGHALFGYANAGSVFARLQTA